MNTFTDVWGGERSAGELEIPRGLQPEVSSKKGRRLKEQQRKKENIEWGIEI